MNEVYPLRAFENPFPILTLENTNGGPILTVPKPPPHLQKLWQLQQDVFAQLHSLRNLNKSIPETFPFLNFNFEEERKYVSTYFSINEQLVQTFNSHLMDFGKQCENLRSLKNQLSEEENKIWNEYKVKLYV